MKPSAVQKKVGRTKGFTHSAETREKLCASWEDPVRKQKYRERLRRSGRDYELAGTAIDRMTVDPDFDEGL